MNVTEQITRGTIEVPAAGGNVTVEISVERNPEGAPVELKASFRRTAKDGSTQYFGSAQAGPDGSVGLYLSATSTPLSDGLKGSLLAAVLKEAAEAFNLEAAEAAE